MMVLRFQCVTPIVSHHLTRPDALGETHAKPGFDHGVGHPLLLLYDAKTPLGKNTN